MLHGPKRRAAETAAILAERFGVTVEPSMLLDDRTAVPSPARRTDYAAHQLPWLDEVPLEERDVDGAAMSAAWHELWSAHTTSEVVLVTHSFVVAWFVREALCAPPAAWMQLMANNATQISIALDPHGGSSLVAFNQRC